MTWLVQSLWLIPALTAHGAGAGAGAERREKVAHGVSRGIAAENRTSPGGASEKKSHSVSRLCGLHVRLILSPLPGLVAFGNAVFWERCPTAGAVGYHLSPLRGCILATVQRARMKPPAQNLCLIPALVVRATGLSALAHAAGAERREKVAHGVSRGFRGSTRQAPEGR